MTSSESMELFLLEVKKLKLLSREEECQLSRQAKLGDEEALEKLVKHNIRFVISVAKKYQNRGLELSDLIQEGCRGMMVAARKFDPEKGIKFISYAVWWIRQSILKSIYDSKMIRVPMQAEAEQRKIFRFLHSYTRQYGTNPSVSDIALFCSLTEQKVIELSEIQMVSLDATLASSDDKSQTLHQKIQLVSQDPFEEIAEQDEYVWKRNELLNAISALPGSCRNKQIFIERYCLDGSVEEPTLETLGERYGVTRERVRQIIEVMLRRVQNHIQKRSQFRESNKA